MRIIIPENNLKLWISARLIRRHSGRQLRHRDSGSNIGRNVITTS
jgi:hypothetical protein